MKFPLSVIILTFNEELNIENCLKNVAGWANEIIVVDSFSGDKTLAIAKKYTDKIVKHTFVNQAEQFNWALDNIKIKNDWILRLDADEYLTEELKAEITEKLENRPDDINGYYMKRRVYFMGRFIKHGGYYPKWFLRLFRREKAHSEEREMDEHLVLSEGEAGWLKNDFVDDNKKDLSWWTEKHNNYSTREAKDVIKGNYGVRKKMFYYKLPPFCRAFCFFVYRYFFLLGFLDGKEGLIFHFLQGFWYRFLVDAKIHEIRKQKINL
ncbi:MAG: glycosyltransferase family 2 protein [Candidatus Moranbacteria bacterium]|nr:glycosyltransferase family 2 protein [Candidatus Moranbacteria bacterium]